MAEKMSFMTEEKFKNIIKDKNSVKDLCFLTVRFDHMDLTGSDLSGISFLGCDLKNVILDKTNMSGCSVENSLFDGTSLRGANLSNADMTCGSFRNCDLSGADISDSNLYGAVLEYANLAGVISNDGTKWFRMHCPETGAFLGYKKCVGQRLVQLLIPADAKRSSATMASCRCNKAKVLTIKSFDYKESYDEAWSLVDENFVYRKGEWVEVKDFNEHRFMDSTTGIHFWLTREEAFLY